MLVGSASLHAFMKGRTSEEVRRAVMTLLTDDEWATWSDDTIAKACGVSDKTVTTHRTHLRNSEDAPATRTVERNGKTDQ